MKPIFKNTLDWEQAQILMQPAFIRVIDNLRHKLEQSTWEGTYQEVENPYPGYELLLHYQQHAVRVNLWDICFQVCFLNYPSPLDNDDNSSDVEKIVEIDINLIQASGDVDWHKLETKTNHLIDELFNNLPSI